MEALSEAQLNEFKDILENKKRSVETQLQTFARKNEDIDNDYQTVFEQIGDSQEENADEVTAYEERLAIEHELESNLQEIDEALERIKHGTYGICANCKKPISLARLQAVPEATLCIECED